MKRKLLSVLLTLCLAFSLLPTAALADGEGTQTNDVAQIGETKYATLQEAVNAANDNTVKLLENVTEDINIPTGINVTLDLNGHKITNVSGHTITVEKGGKLNISDSVGTGVVDNTSHGKGAIVNSGEVTLNGGTFERSAEKGTYSPYGNGGNSWYTIANYGTMEINTGVTVKNAGGYSSMIRNGGDVTADCNLTIKGGNFTGGVNTVKNDSFGVLTINGGNFSNTAQYVIMNWNKAEITAGTFQTLDTASAVLFTSAYGGDANTVGKLTISGGEFKHASDTQEMIVDHYDASNSGTAAVTGGKFDADISKYIPTDYVQSADGTVEKLGETNAVAKVGGTYYKTLADAVKAVKDNETITLLKDVTLSGDLAINNGKIFTIDLNGKTLGGADLFINGSAFVTATNGTITGDVWLKTTDTDAAYNSFTLAEDAKIDTAGYGIVVTQIAVGATNYGSAVDIQGSVTGKESALWVLGNITTDLQTAKNPVTVTVGPKAKLINSDQTKTALQMAGACVVTIADGAQVTGGTAIEVRAGKLTVNGGTITGTGIPTTVQSNGNGTSTTGAGIGVAQHTTGLPIEVTINSGAISGYTAFFESNPQGNDETAQAGIALNIAGGYFVATNGGKNAVSSESGKTGFITGGTFTGVTAENYLDKGCKLENGKVVPADDSVAKIGNKGYKTLAEALNAVKDGETITLLKDTNLPDAEYYINKSVTINGSGKISCTVKTGKTTRAFVVEENGSLTLDGVVLDIQGTKNPDTAEKNDGTGIDVQFGGKLVLKNQAVLKLHDLERGTISSKPDGSPEIPGQFVIDNSTFNSTNIDGNISNGGDWTVTNGSTVNINNCGSYGLSVDSLTTEQSTVNVSGTGYSAIYGKDLQFKDGSNVLINGAGTKLPLQSPWSDARSPIQTHKDGGTIVVESGATVTVRDCVDKDGKANNTIYLPNNTTYTNNGTVNATIITAVAPENSFVVTLVSDGKTIGVQTVAKDSEFTLPAAPEKNNYTFNGWYDGSTKVSSPYKVTKNVTLTASWSYNYSGGSSSYDPTYSVSTPSKTKNGTVTVSPKSASKGDTVTVTVKPDSGYVLETLTVTDKNGNELTLKDKGNGKYTFTMPAGKVEVKATFMEDNSMLNFFYDVPNNAYFYEAVKWAVKNGITTGVGNDLFAPEQPCTRAQIVTFLWRAAGSPEPKGAASGMTDVVSGGYYEKAVAWAIENGITTGTTTSTFSPDATCTRAQAVTFLARALKAKAASAAEFSDVPNDSYFADAVAWAAANGVTEGIGGGLFGSDNDCTRGQIVTFLYRAYNK